MNHAVIGARYGDEGKGLITDFLSDRQSLVIRYNGGAQAGHTVVTPEGLRHEFHHLGAGTFRGASTLLSRYFICNPILFKKEWKELERHITSPTCFVDPNAIVTTPFDMLLNQWCENKRAGDRHGSCGVGINETVTRCETVYNLTVKMLYDRATIEDRLWKIYTEWVPSRAAKLDVLIPIDPALFINKFLEDIDYFINRITLKEDIVVMKNYGHLLFEGAQGLRLDEFSSDFPHVTRSRTGLTNVVKLLDLAQIDDPLEVYYVSRSYVTRHGAGPLPDEILVNNTFWSSDETNTPNEYQGHLRYAPFENSIMGGDIHKDLKDNPYRGYLRPYQAITCLDQLEVSNPQKHILDKLATGWMLPIGLWSYGSTRKDVRFNYDQGIRTISSDRIKEA